MTINMTFNVSNNSKFLFSFSCFLISSLAILSNNVYAKDSSVLIDSVSSVNLNSSNYNADAKILTNALNEFKNISGDFTQLQARNTANMNNKQQLDKVNIKQLSGNFTFANKNQFIWQYSKPLQQLIQSDGNNIYIYDKDLAQVTIKKLDVAINASPISIFMNNKEWQKHFSVTKFSENTWTNKALLVNNPKINLQWFMLKPKANDSIYKNLSIAFSIDNKTNKYKPSVLTFQDTLGNDGLILLSSLHKQAINSNSFKFEIPAGVDITK